MYIKKSDEIGQYFFENRNVCVEPVDLALNEECYVVDQSIIDEENGTYAIIPCIVVRIDESPTIRGRRYYMLQAHDSKNDAQMNSQVENGIMFYKYLENTSPFIIKINQIIG